MKIRWWPHTEDPRVASYRLRCLQIIDALERGRLDVGLYRPDAPRPPDLLVLSKRYDATTLDHVLALRSRTGCRLLLDLCDNHLHVDNAEPRLLARADALRRAIAAADHVVAASEALAQVVRQASPVPVRIAVIADAAEPPFEPVGLARLRHGLAELALRGLVARLDRSAIPRPRRLLWFGNHGSAGAEGGMADLQRIRSALELAHAARPLSLSVISNDRAKYEQLTRGWQLPCFYLPWDAHSFSRATRLHGAAVIPVGLNPFTRCKTNNRMATAFLHGLNVVADAIPSYQEFAGCSVLGDWSRGLGPYLGDLARRERDLVAAQELLRERYSLDRIATQWRAVIEDAVAAGRAPHGADT
jgi:hypothetical protein